MATAFPQPAPGTARTTSCVLLGITEVVPKKEMIAAPAHAQIHVRSWAYCGQEQRPVLTVSDANDAVDGAHSAASRCHRVVASKRTTLRGAVHGRG